MKSENVKRFNAYLITDYVLYEENIEMVFIPLWKVQKKKGVSFKYWFGLFMTENFYKTLLERENLNFIDVLKFFCSQEFNTEKCVKCLTVDYLGRNIVCSASKNLDFFDLDFIKDLTYEESLSICKKDENTLLWSLESVKEE